MPPTVTLIPLYSQALLNICNTQFRFAAIKFGILFYSLLNFFNQLRSSNHSMCQKMETRLRTLMCIERCDHTMHARDS